jgi:IclR family transcriptional regulator, pca regulon regulatory protein
VEDEQRDREFVQSLERGLAVLRAFSAEAPALTLSEVAQMAGLTRAAARRFLLTLVTLGYVGTDGRLFSLRPKVLELGYAYLSSLPIWDVAQPHMEALVDELRESSSASVLDDGQIVYVARVPTKRIMSVGLSIGSRLPAYPTSMGRVLLAHLPPDELDRYLETVELVGLTNRTITSTTALRRVLEGVRACGWALVDQELEEGVRSVAAPLRDASGTVLAAVNVSAHAARVTLGTLRGRFLSALLATVDAINADLAVRYRGSSGRRSG